MIQRFRQHRQILNRFWNGLDSNHNGEVIRHLPESADGLLADLVTEFGEDHVLDSGIAVRNDAGRNQLTPRLGGPSSPVMILVDEPGGLPFDLVCGNRLLLGAESLIRAAVHDASIRRALQQQDRVLLLVPSVEDAGRCSMLGLAAIPIDEVERLTAEELRWVARTVQRPELPLLPAVGGDSAIDEGSLSSTTLAEAPDVHSPLCESTTDHVAHQGANIEPGDRDELDVINVPMDTIDEILIAGWSFSSHQHVMSSPMQAVVTHFANAGQYLGHDMSNVATWIPSPSDAARIRFCFEMQDIEAMRSAVRESMDASCFKLRSALSTAAAMLRGAGTLAEARSALWNSVGDPHVPTREHDILVQEFRSAMARDVIDPIITAGLEQRDPVAGALYVELANVTSMLQMQAPFLQADLLRTSNRSDPPKVRANLDRSLRSRMKMINSLVAIAREIRQR